MFAKLIANDPRSAATIDTAPPSGGERIGRRVKNSWALTATVVAIVIGGTTGCSVGDVLPHAASSKSPVAPPDDEGRSVANYFKVGDCFQDPVTGATTVTLVDCEKPHSGEVYAIFPLPDGPFPGNDISGEFKKKCGGFARENFPPELGKDPTLRTTVRFPDEKSWAIGDRSVTCIASSDPPRTGSIRTPG